METATRTGPELRQLREEAGISLLVLATRIGFNDSVLSRIERGYQSVPPDLIAQYEAAVLEIVRERAAAVEARLSPVEVA